eukprot:s1878_g20.t1
MRFASEDELLAAHTVPHYAVAEDQTKGARSFVDVRPLGRLPPIPDMQEIRHEPETPQLRSSSAYPLPAIPEDTEAEAPTPMVIQPQFTPEPVTAPQQEPPVPLVPIDDNELAPDDEITRQLTGNEPEPQPATASAPLQGAMQMPDRLDGLGVHPNYVKLKRLTKDDMAFEDDSSGDSSPETVEEEGNPKISYAFMTGRAARFDELTEEEISKLPPDTKVIGTRWVHTDKNSKSRLIAYHLAKKTGKSREQVDKEFPFEAKSRCVVQGCQEDETGIRSDSPPASLLAFNLVCAISTIMRWVLAAYDASTAYLQAKGTQRLLILKAPYPPPPGVAPGTLFRAKGSIYGTKDAGRSWWKKLAADAKLVGWIMSGIESALFYLHGGAKLVGIMASHVDNLITCGEGPVYETAMKKLADLIYLKEKRSTFRFCGKNVVQNEDFTVTIEQVDAIEALEYQVIDKAKRKNVNAPLNESEKTDFRALIGSMGWISRQTRPDVMVNVSMASQTMGDPRVKDVVELNKAVKMLKESPEAPWKFYPIRSFLGQLCRLRGEATPVLLLETTSSSIKRVCRSTLAAESNAFLMGVEAADYISALLREILNPNVSLTDLEDHYPKKPIIAFTDAKSLEATIVKEAGQPSDKRVKLLVAQIKEYLAENCRVIWVDTSQMLADVLTKVGCERALLLSTMYRGEWQLLPSEAAQQDGTLPAMPGASGASHLPTFATDTLEDALDFLGHTDTFECQAAIEFLAQFSGVLFTDHKDDTQDPSSDFGGHRLSIVTVASDILKELPPCLSHEMARSGLHRKEEMGQMAEDGVPEEVASALHLHLLRELQLACGLLLRARSQLEAIIGFLEGSRSYDPDTAEVFESIRLLRTPTAWLAMPPRPALASWSKERSACWEEKGKVPVCFSMASFFNPQGKAAKAQEYPPAFCKAVVDGIKAQIRKDGGWERCEAYLAVPREDGDQGELHESYAMDEDDDEEMGEVEPMPQMEQANPEAIEVAGEASIERPVTEEEIRAVHKLHKGLGHPAIQDLVRFMKSARVKPEVNRWTSKSFACPICEARPRTKTIRPATIPKTYQPNRVIGIDLIFLPGIGGESLLPALSVVDYGSNFQLVELLESKDPDEVWSALWRCWMRTFGVPEVLTCDAGKEFAAGFCKRATACGIVTYQVGARAPWQNGKAERHGAHYKELLDKARSEMVVTSIEELKLLMQEVEQAKNRFSNRSGFSPVQRQIGQWPRCPTEILSDDVLDPTLVAGAMVDDLERLHEMRRVAQKAFVESNARRAVQKTLNARGRTVEEFKPGDYVYVYRIHKPRKRRYGGLPERDTARNKPCWVGPGTVVMVDGANLWISVWGELWKAAKEQCRLATTSEKDGIELIVKECQELIDEYKKASKKAGYKDITDEPYPEIEDAPAEAENPDQPPARHVRFEDEAEYSPGTPINTPAEDATEDNVRRASRATAGTVPEPEEESNRSMPPSIPASTSQSSVVASQGINSEDTSGMEAEEQAHTTATEQARSVTLQQPATAVQTSEDVMSRSIAMSDRLDSHVGRGGTRPVRGWRMEGSRQAPYLWEMYLEAEDEVADNEEEDRQRRLGQLTQSDIRVHKGDYWSVDLEENKIVRHHRRKRKALFHPEDDREMPVKIQDLLKTRKTYLHYKENLPAEEVQDHWTERRQGKSRPTWWKGSTVFYLKNEIPEEEKQALRVLMMEKKRPEEVDMKRETPQDLQEWKMADKAEWDKMAQSGAVKVLSLEESRKDSYQVVTGVVISDSVMQQRHATNLTVMEVTVIGMKFCGEVFELNAQALAKGAETGGSLRFQLTMSLHDRDGRTWDIKESSVGCWNSLMTAANMSAENQNRDSPPSVDYNNSSDEERLSAEGPTLASGSNVAAMEVEVKVRLGDSGAVGHIPETRDQERPLIPRRVENALQNSRDFTEYRRNRPFKFMHLYSGANDVLGKAIEMEAARNRLSTVVLSLDCKLDPSLDLADPGGFAVMRDEVAQGEWDFVHAGFPSPERSAQHRHKVPDQPGTGGEDESVRLVRMATQAVQIYEMQVKSCVARRVTPLATFENLPESDNSKGVWGLPEVLRCLQNTAGRKIPYDACAFQVKDKDRWARQGMWAGRLENIHKIQRVCKCPAWIKHWPVDDETTHPKAREYPADLVELVAAEVVTMWKRTLSLEWWRHQMEVNPQGVDELQKSWLENEEMKEQGSLKRAPPAKRAASVASKIDSIEDDEVGIKTEEKAAKFLKVGRKLASLWAEFAESHPGALDVAVNYGQPSNSIDPELLLFWRKALRENLGKIKEIPVTVKEDWQFNTDLETELWEVWGERASDPDGCLPWRKAASRERHGNG